MLFIFFSQQLALISCLAFATKKCQAFSPSLTQVGSNRGRDSLTVASYSTASGTDLGGLKSLGFPEGLCDALIRDSFETTHRYWILDNSGSMATPDGNRLVETSAGGTKLSSCTRWKELQETAIYHAQLAGYLQVPTEFQFLNSLGPFNKHVLVKNQNDAMKAQRAIQRAEPMGATPLTAAVQDVKKKIEAMVPKLSKDGSQVSLIATDGLPTDNMGYGGDGAKARLGEALESLSGLPVSTIIRLCTDDEQVVNYYNSFDGSLELRLDVLDDFVGEAKEVQAKNKWLTYGLPLHRFREGGFRCRLADLLDERKLTKDELRDFASFLFGEAAMMDGLPDPQVDWTGFQREVGRFQSKEDLVYNPATKKMTPWFQLSSLGGVFY